MLPRASWLLTLAISTLVHGLIYDPELVDYNLNTQQNATDPLDYWGQRDTKSFNYTPSPENWRFPVYTLFLDRWVNGDPTNDNANGTIYEQDPHSNQMRHGGDLQGLVDSLDYISGMGIKAIYIAGSIFINQPWGADSYSVGLPSHRSARGKIDDTQAEAVLTSRSTAARPDTIGFPLRDIGRMAGRRRRDTQGGDVCHPRQHHVHVSACLIPLQPRGSLVSLVGGKPSV